jgi:hypothetical protein
MWGNVDPVLGVAHRLMPNKVCSALTLATEAGPRKAREPPGDSGRLRRLIDADALLSVELG